MSIWQPEPEIKPNELLLDPKKQPSEELTVVCPALFHLIS
jgi:hypothetical protein